MYVEAGATHYLARSLIHTPWQMSWMAILRSFVSETYLRTASESHWIDSGAALVTVLFGEGMFLFRLYAIYERNKKRQCHFLSLECEVTY